MKRNGERNKPGINPGRLAEHYLKQTIEQLLTAIERGDTENAGAALVQLSRIDDQRAILGAKIGPAIERLEATGVDFSSMHVPNTAEDEAISNWSCRISF
jgi:hypothetical protein